MEIQKIEIIKINPAAYNPRIDLKPGDPDYEKLKKSINTFGYVEPLVWNSRTGNLVGGHQRLKILIEQGFKEVDVSVVDLDLEKEKALNLALNKISGDWDQYKLSQLLDELTKIEGFDTGVTGFDLKEISQIFDRFEDPPQDNFDLSMALNQNTKPITAPGDLIELDGHRLLCGDSSKTEDIERLLTGKKAGLLFTDPPYNVNYGENLGGDKQEQWRRIVNDNMPQDQYEKWLRQIIRNACSVLDQGAAVYIWNGSRQFGPMYEMLIEEGLHVSSVITWAKETFAFGRFDYKQQAEYCLYAWKENNGAHKWYGPDNETTLWQIKRDSTTSYIHPTQKPVALAHRAIKNSSKRDDIILDLFLGSGTTLIAAESLQRWCYGMEFDPLYCDAIVKRYVQFTGREKIKPEILRKYSL